MTKKPGSNPDDLIKSKTKGGAIELSEKELEQAAGGAFIEFEGIDGEAKDKDHKSIIEIASARTKPYSWVDQRSQEALLQFVDRHLNPGGVFYLSYYAMPGRAFDLPVQRLVRALGLTLSGDSAEQCAGAIEMVRMLSDLKIPALANSPMAVTLGKPLSKYDRGYHPHEYMTADWNPLCVTEVREAMRGIGLGPAGSATLMDNFDSFVLRQAAREVLTKIADADVRELARDFIINQSFRRDVFVRHGRALDGIGRRARLLETSFALARPADSVHYVCKTPAGHLKYDNRIARSIVGALEHGPRSLVSICSESSLAPDDVLANALVLSAAEAIRPVEKRQSFVSGLNGAVCRRLGGPEEIHFVALPSGTALLLDDELLQFVAGNRQRESGNSWHDLLAAYNVSPVR